MSVVRRWPGVFVVVCLCAGLMWVPAQPSARPGQPTYMVGSQSSLKPLPIYAKDPRDAWNQIFFHLFTREIRTRASGDFRDAGPFLPWKAFSSGRVRRLSTRVFARIESGDQAILPLYKGRRSMFPHSGEVDIIVKSKRFHQFFRALGAMLLVKGKRPALHRAVMQADLWAAFDRIATWRAKTPTHQKRRKLLLRFLAQAIKAIALTPKEIRALPNNYAQARKQHKLPDILGKKSGWIEARWMPRFHDKHFGKRMAARIFYLPKQAHRSPALFLKKLRRTRHLSQRTKLLKAVALLLQPMLVDRQGTIHPTHLTYAVQIRQLSTGTRSLAKRLHVFEIQRQRLLQIPGDAGLRRLSHTHPAYLQQGGNDYSFFTTVQPGKASPAAVLVPLHKRCAGCHGPKLDAPLSLSIHHFVRKPLVLIPKQGHAHAHFLRKQKQIQADFLRLRGWIVQGKARTKRARKTR